MNFNYFWTTLPNLHDINPYNISSLILYLQNKINIQQTGGSALASGGSDASAGDGAEPKKPRRGGGGGSGGGGVGDAAAFPDDGGDIPSPLRVNKMGGVYPLFIHVY